MLGGIRGEGRVGVATATFFDKSKGAASLFSCDALLLFVSMRLKSIVDCYMLIGFLCMLIIIISVGYLWSFMVVIELPYM